MRKPIIILSLLAALHTPSSQAQDAHFSQYFVSPLSINPALTGFMDGTARAMVNYRSQWASVNNAFTTTTASLDGIILQSKIPSIDRFGVGLMMMSDKVADGLMTNNYLAFSTSYHKGLDKEGRFSLGVGLQAIYANRGIDGSKLQLNDELDNYGNFSVGSKDAVATNQTLRSNYFDASAGLVFKAKINDRNQFYIGVSTYHLSQPKANFTANSGDATLTVPMRTTINAGYEAKVSDMLSISAIGLYTKQESASETVIGGIATIGRSYREYEHNLTGYLGCLYRFGDAVIPYVGLEYYDVRFGFSYDYNTSSLNAATKGQGGAEVSIVYLLRIPPNKRIQYLCPNNPKF